MTDYLFRVLLIVPSDRKAGLEAFIAAEFHNAEWLVAELSASGTAPATHYMTCFACTLADTSRWANRLATDGGVPLPPEFQYYNADQRIAFISAARATLKENTGVSVYVCRNDQQWFNVSEILEDEQLVVIDAIIP